MALHSKYHMVIIHTQKLWSKVMKVHAAIVALLHSDKESVKAQVVKLMETSVLLFSYRSQYAVPIAS